MTKIVPVILSGGSGTRLWPLSRGLLPKQLLPLASDRSMLQETVLRATGDDFAAPLIICNDKHRFMVAEQLRELEVEPLAIVLEPLGRNTAPAAAIAALLIAKQAPDAMIILLPSDHVIAHKDRLHDAASLARSAANGGALVTFGIQPDKPETAYGYIKAGEAAGVDGVFWVERFVEKPGRETAQAYLDEGSYYWNSGMFLFAPLDFLGELEKFNPAMLDACRKALSEAQTDHDFVRLDMDAFAASPSDSMDYAVMEKTDHAAVVPVDLGWNDVGAWSALWEIGDQDADGNVLKGDIVTQNVRDSYIRSEGPLIAASDVDNVIIVATDDVLMIADKAHAQDVKKVVEQLKAEGRTEHETHSTVHRPWGWYQTIGLGPRYQVKQICLKPGAAISLQLHHHRAEHWVVVEGTARVTRDEDVLKLTVNQSAYIPLGATHRLENPGEVLLRIIEVQSGSYLGEDDIVRFEDTYGRS
jgi:mannose-1-phosphate guanylyltransferase/mannose-6-phosphate isomerase